MILIRCARLPGSAALAAEGALAAGAARLVHLGVSRAVTLCRARLGFAALAVQGRLEPVLDVVLGVGRLVGGLRGLVRFVGVWRVRHDDLPPSSVCRLQPGTAQPAKRPGSPPTLRIPATAVPASGVATRWGGARRGGVVARWRRPGRTRRAWRPRSTGAAGGRCRCPRRRARARRRAPPGARHPPPRTSRWPARRRRPARWTVARPPATASAGSPGRPRTHPRAAAPPPGNRRSAGRTGPGYGRTRRSAPAHVR